MVFKPKKKEEVVDKTETESVKEETPKIEPKEPEAQTNEIKFTRDEIKDMALGNLNRAYQLINLL